MKELPLSDQRYLLQQLQNGDKRAFSALYERYYGALYLHAYNRLRNREVAKDLVQDLFTQLWAKREHLQIREGLSSYLYRWVRNRVIDHVARQHLNSRYIQSFGNYLLEPGNTTDHRVRERQLNALIEKEIARLPPQVCTVFRLSRKQHLSHKEIAYKLGLSEQTVRSYVKSALKILKVKLGTLFTAGIYALLKIF